MKKKLLILLLSIFTIASSIGFKNIQVNATDALPDWNEEDLAEFLEMAKHPREPFTIEVPIADNSGRKAKALGDMYNMTIWEDSSLGYRAANPSTGGYNFGMFGYIHNDSTGQYVFCLDPFTIVTTGNGYTATTPSSFITNPGLLTTIQDIATFGNQLAKETGDLVYYRAAQLMIWSDLGHSVELTNGFNGSAVNIDWAKNAIQGRINNFYTYPSFENASISLRIGESHTFTDTNGVLPNFSVYENNGNLSISKNGNEITVTATASSGHGANTIRFEAFRNLVSPSFVYQKSGSQTMGSFGKNDPAFMGINITVIPYGTATVLKNNDSGVAIPGTVFDFSPNADMSGSTRYTTDANGKFTVADLVQGTYYFREVSVPSPLVVDTTIKSINVVAGQDNANTVINQTVKGEIEINKREDASSVGYINQTLAGASYEIKNSSNVVATLNTDSNGYAKTGLLPLGTYTVKETVAPVGYLLDPTTYTITLSYANQTTSVVTNTQNLTDKVISGQGEITKMSFNGKVVVPGTSYKLFKEDGTFIKSITTGTDGKAVTGVLRYGNYYLVEESVPSPYLIDTTPIPFQIRSDQSLVKVSQKNTVPRGSITVNKSEDTSSSMYINQKLSGAKYGLYAATDIVEMNEELYVKDQLIQSVTTGADGKATFSNLPLGSYYLKEIESPIGYVLDSNTYPVTITYKDQSTPVIEEVQVDLTNKVVSGKLRVIKTTHAGTILLPSAKFGIYEKGTDLLVEELVTNQVGIAESSSLRYGNYYLKEIDAPYGYYINLSTFDFNIDVDGEMEHILVNNQEARAKVMVKKVDAVNHEPMANVGFSIADEQMNIIEFDVIVGAKVQKQSVFYTDVDGELLINNYLYFGNYYLVESETPFGYEPINPIPFTVDENQTYIEIPVIGTVKDFEVANNRKTASLEVIKTDGVTKVPLEGFEFNVLDSEGYIVETITTGADGKATTTIPLLYNETYSVVEVKTGVKYYSIPENNHVEVIINEDIEVMGITNTMTHFDVKLNKINEFTNLPLVADFAIINKETEKVVFEGTTDLNGELMIPMLEFNKSYILRETNAPKGYFVMKDIEFMYDQLTYQELITLTATNIHSRVEISKVEIGKDEELPGSTLQVLDENKVVLYEWVSTDKPYYIEMLPVGKYVLRETLATPGYGIANDLKFEVVETGEIQSFKIENQPTKTIFEKRDIETKEILDGGEFSIYKLREIQAIVPLVENIEQEGIAEEIQDNRYEYEGKLYEKEMIVVDFENLLDQDGESTDIFEYLTPGMYLVEEVKAPTGYAINDQVVFEVTATNETLLVTQYDAKTIYSIIGKKVDSNTHAVLPGAEFTLYDENMKEIETAVANQEGLVEFKVTFGRYFVKETKAPVGYKLSDEVIEIDVTGTEDADYLFEFELPNTPLPVAKLPSTGLSDSYSMLGGSMMFAGLGLAVLTSRKKEGEINE